MPQRPNRPCKHPRCSGKTREKHGYCIQHEEYGITKRKESKRTKKTSAFYGSSRWQKYREWYGSKHPLCEDCLEAGKTVPKYCVDHVVEIKDGGALTSEENSRSLCFNCHAAKTAKARKERGK